MAIPRRSSCHRLQHRAITACYRNLQLRQFKIEISEKYLASFKIPRFLSTDFDLIAHYLRSLHPASLLSPPTPQHMPLILGLGEQEKFFVNPNPQILVG